MFGWSILTLTGSLWLATQLPLTIPLGDRGSLAFRDARVLSDELLAGTDWDAAANRYAQRHDTDYGIVKKVSGWFYDVFQRLGPQADARRARALPMIAQDPTRVPDVLFSGPEFPLDATSHARFFGEDSF